MTSKENVTSPRSSTHTVVAGIIERDGRFLICQRRRDNSHPLRWEFPGGKVEPGESPRAALERELMEELAIQAVIGPQMGSLTHRYGDRPPFHLLFFRVDAFTGEPRNLIFEQLRWELPSRLPDYNFLEADADFVRKLASEQPCQDR